MASPCSHRKRLSSAVARFGFGIPVLGFLAVLSVLFPAGARAAEEFGDISVSPNAIYTGNTYHGYAEMRIVVENRSTTKAHAVTLVYPNEHGYGMGGNNISRLTRTVAVAPGAREIVSLLQPPLPANGDGSIRVVVDGHNEGLVRAPNANNHCTHYSRFSGSSPAATILVSRNLDFDAVTHAFQANTDAFSAAKAVGPPDSGATSYDPNSWMPDVRHAGVVNWLELDYAKPQIVTKVTIHHPPRTVLDGYLILVGVSGTNLARISMSSVFDSPTIAGVRSVITVLTTNEPVKTVRLDFGRGAPNQIAIDAVELSGPGGAQWAADARASSDNSASAPRFRPGVSGETVDSLRAESPVSEWSENWLAYSPFDAVLVDGSDLAAMPPAVLGAVGDYIQAGGNLVVFGKTALPGAWHTVKVKRTGGDVEVSIGFGTVFMLAAGKPAAMNSASQQAVRQAVLADARYFTSLPSDTAAANAVLPVVANVNLPTRGIVLAMLGFIVLIGPANMLYLSRIKRRTWMLWTIPAISLATMLLIFAYSLFREGITPDARIRGITVLDQVSHQAATIGAEAFYCPLTPGGGLQFDFITEATPLVSLGYGSGTPRDVDWTQFQHFQHGWVAARVPEHFHVRKVETRRERMQVVKEGGKLQIVNSLGAPIQTLWLADASFNLYQAAHIGAGEKGPLLLTQPRSVPGNGGVAALLRDVGFAGQTNGLNKNASGYLVANSYVAVLEGNPFLENALGRAANARRTQSACVIFGVLDADEFAGGAR